MRKEHVLVPRLDDLTAHEREWVRFLRTLTGGGDSGPTLLPVQALNRASEGETRQSA